MKMSKYINEMDVELTDRFKALKVLMDDCNDIDEEEQTEYRKLELQFEEKYKEIYAMREKLVNGKNDESYLMADILKEFDEVAVKFKDEDYEKLVVEPCDVKSIQNTPKGVSDFWMKALL